MSIMKIDVQAGFPVFRITLPNWCVCCDDIHYKVTLFQMIILFWLKTFITITIITLTIQVWNFEDGEEVGTITRQWPGFCKQV